MGIVLGANRYGKAEVRLVRVIRDSPRHELRDLTVSTALRGDFAAAYTAGDQANVLPTDSQKNTVYAYAREKGVGAVEEFGLTLARHFVTEVEPVTAARVAVEEYGWDRVEVDGRPHDHAFVRSGREVRTATATVDGTDAWMVAGLRDLTLLKSTGSEFAGFLQDRYTTLAETYDRVMATSLVARWRYAGTDVAWDTAYESVRAALLATYARVHSLALQQTLWEMGKAVLEAHDQVVEIRLSAPNRHHFLVDLEPFGLDNPGEVFHAADRPYGLIEATVTRDDAPDAAPAWDGP